MVPNQLERIFQHSHHAKTKQVNLDDAQIGTIFFVPLHHYTTGHRSRLERNYGIKLSLADDHATGMLTQVARQVLDRLAELKIFAQPRMT